MVIEIVDNASDAEEVSEPETEPETEIHGDVETVEGDEEVVIEDGDTNVTVIDNDSDAVEAVVTERTIDNAVELAELRTLNAATVAGLEALSERVAVLESRIESDETAVVNVFEEAEEEAAESDEEENSEEEEDREPNSAGVHPLFRSWRDTFRRD